MFFLYTVPSSFYRKLTSFRTGGGGGYKFVTSFRKGSDVYNEMCQEEIGVNLILE